MKIVQFLLDYIEYIIGIKLGAKQEGVFRNNYVDSEGKSKNDVYFSIIQEEWENIKQTQFYK